MDGLRTDNYPDGWSESDFSRYWDDCDGYEEEEPDECDWCDDDEW